jgi:hypothetical protein
MSYAKTLIEAGLNSVNISIHGATAKTHNAMMRTPNAFELGIKGIKNLQTLQRVLNQRIHFMSMCLAAPQVLKEFPEHIRLMGELGIRLHMVQPLLINPGNANFADRMMSSYEDIASAIRAGVEVAKDHGGHIKLFNTPVCMFWDIEQHLERQGRALDVAKIGQPKVKHAKQLSAEDGYYRIDGCHTCIEPCNGFRIEYYPQDKIVADIQNAMRSSHTENPQNSMWIGGTELLAPHSWNTITHLARDLGLPRFSILASGYGRTYGEGFSQENLEHIDELSFRVIGRRTGRWTGIPYLQLHGNLEDLEKTLTRIRRFDKRPLVSAFLSPGDLAANDVIEFVERSPFDIVRLFCHDTPGALELWVTWPFRMKRILETARRLHNKGKEVILMSAAPPQGAGPFKVESFWDQWVHHRWVVPPHPDLTHPFAWNRVQQVRTNWSNKRLLTPLSMGPDPLSMMPTTPTALLPPPRLKHRNS